MTRDFPLRPENTTLHLVSSLDETAPVIADLIPRGRLVVIETARLAEGRSFAPGETLPFEEFGFEITLCDLKRETARSIDTVLEGAVGCVILGGNTFALMEQMERVSFGSSARRRGLRGGPVFHIVGESAGAVAMGATITHVASMDDPSVASRRTDAGLGWIDARVLPHRGCPHWGFGEAVERVIAEDADPDSLLIIDEAELRTFPAG